MAVPATYRLEAHLIDGTFIQVLPASNMQGESMISRPDALRWDMPLYDSTIFSRVDNFYPGKCEVWLYRNDEVIFAGPWWDATASSKEGKMSCAAEGLESYLDVRRVDWDLDVEDDTDEVMWSLIEDTQALTDGDLFITRGATDSMTPRKFAIRRKEGKYISDVLKDYAALQNGFDWKIEPDTREFRLWHPFKDITSDSLLEWGGAIKHYSVQIIGKWARNDILSQGAGEMTETAIDPTLRAEWGLRQYTDSYKDAARREGLEDRARKVREARKKGKVVPSISVVSEHVNPFRLDLTWGQTVQVKINDGPLDYDEVMRCVGFQYTISSEFSESFVYYLNNLSEMDVI